MLFPIFVSCPKGLENLLTVELQALGLQNAKNSPQGVFGDATITAIYQIALWSRLANRIHLILFSGQAYNSQMLYRSCEQFAWQTVFRGQDSFKVQFHGTSEQLRNEMYSAQVIKDAVVDHFRKLSGHRPDVNKHDAQIQIHAYLKHDQVTVSLDLVGYSLHQRGYRKEQGQAPLKENVAAALLWRMNWPQIARQGGSFADLMCGSGTIVIEAALMACQIAPGLLRQDQAFPHWIHHQANLWEKLRAEAKAQQISTSVAFYGSDIQARAIEKAQENAKRAGVEHLIQWSHLAIHGDHAAKDLHPGLLVINPPYGERLGEQLDLIPTYRELGNTLYHQFSKWQAGILTSDPMLAKAIGLRSHKSYAFFNGSIPCQLYCIQLDENNQLKQGSHQALSQHAQMLANRLQKNFAHLNKWAQRQQIECYRIYDADLPEYAFAIDKYGDYFVLQEYMPPKAIPEHVAANRRLDMMTVLPQVFHMTADKLIIKQRKPQKEKQYQKTDNKKQFITVHEGQAQFYLNLHDYLDTGIFLDHRILRLEFAKLPPMTRFLNLFCYTATASVHAALAGAKTTNVDLSNTYINWATQNFQLNRILPQKHKFIQSDVFEWLKSAQETFDVIYMDTPSFSNSKRMKGTLDIQRDHVFMIRMALKRLHPEGKLYFSTHLRSFKLDESINEFAKVQNISRRTLDEDFKRDPKIHQCFIIEPIHSS
jgi:23S rRNA (guanine2445-N2)-methyltransferase / 23S rRNA (guanine2069-N7)-methyltransferase